MRRALSLLLSLPSLLACAGASPQVTDAREVTLEEMRIVARSDDAGDLVVESYDAGQLFERGTALVEQGECAPAVERFYARLIREFADSRYVSVALYNSGICFQQAGELAEAVPHFEQLLERSPESRDARHGSLQLAEILLRLERFEPAGQLTDRILLREDLDAPERLEGMARRAQALIGLERFEDAERQARSALSYYRRQDQTGQIPDPAFAATANYALAESMRLRASRLALPEGTAEEQHQVLDARSRLLLSAQHEYFNTIRHTNAHWASAAGYQIGAMYDELWTALMSAPIPPPNRELSPAAMPLYREEYRRSLADHIEPLLRHAIRYWELTLLMVERTGVRSEWAERTREDLDRMRLRLLEQVSPDPGEEMDAILTEPQATLRLPRQLRGAVAARIPSAL